MRWIIVAAVVPAVIVSGCATKRYGRLQPLTGAERVGYDCKDIDIEIAKVGSFQQQVREGAQFNMASVLGILGDYGIGNSMERGAAEASAGRRMKELTDLKAERGCGGTYLTSADQAAAVASIGNASRAVLSTNPGDTPGTIDLGGGVRLVPSSSLSGYCIQAPAGYVGTGSVNRPAVTAARPKCN
jgi:hypothetical protein